MKEYLLKQPKATCVLFSIACKINLGLVNNNEIRAGGGVFGLGNPGGRGGHSDPGNPGGRGGSKNLAIRRRGVDFFWNNQFDVKISNSQFNSWNSSLTF